MATPLKRLRVVDADDQNMTLRYKGLRAIASPFSLAGSAGSDHFVLDAAAWAALRAPVLAPRGPRRAVDARATVIALKAAAAKNPKPAR